MEPKEGLARYYQNRGGHADPFQWIRVVSFTNHVLHRHQAPDSQGALIG